MRNEFCFMMKRGALTQEKELSSNIEKPSLSSTACCEILIADLHVSNLLCPKKKNNNNKSNNDSNSNNSNNINDNNNNNNINKNDLTNKRIEIPKWMTTGEMILDPTDDDTLKKIH